MTHFPPYPFYPLLPYFILMFKASLKVKENTNFGQQMKFNGRIWDSFQSNVVKHLKFLEYLMLLWPKEGSQHLKNFLSQQWGSSLGHAGSAHSTIPQAYHNPPTPAGMFLEKVPDGEALNEALARDVITPLLHGSVLNEEVLVIVLGQALVFLLVQFFFESVAKLWLLCQ
jgi:hypothetical protein